VSHPGVAVPELSEWIGWWTIDPLVIAGLATATVIYTIGALRMPRPRPFESVAFAAGILILALALLSPLDRASDVLFSAHMVQHELLMLIAAPLIVIGRPYIPFVWALPHDPRIRMLRAAKPGRIWRFMTHPVIALTLHAAARIAWHVPALFDAALADDRIHAFQHLTFFTTAVLFWWSLIHGRYGRFGYGMGVAFVFFTMIYTGLLGAILVLGQHALYAHAEPTLRWGIDPVEDQQRAGLLMWVPAGVIMTSIGLAIFAAWLGQSARAADREDQDSDALRHRHHHQPPLVRD
jgi:putative membrane protein